MTSLERHSVPVFIITGDDAAGDAGINWQPTGSRGIGREIFTVRFRNGRRNLYVNVLNRQSVAANLIGSTCHGDVMLARSRGREYDAGIFPNAAVVVVRIGNQCAVGPIDAHDSRVAQD